MDLLPLRGSVLLDLLTLAPLDNRLLLDIVPRPYCGHDFIGSLNLIDHLIHETVREFDRILHVPQCCVILEDESFLTGIFEHYLYQHEAGFSIALGD